MQTNGYFSKRGFRWARNAGRLILVTVFGAALLASTETALAQGKIAFGTDSLHLVYYDPSVPGVGGTCVYNANTPGGVQLVADLYMGSTSSALSLYSTTTPAVEVTRWRIASTRLARHLKPIPCTGKEPATPCTRRFLSTLPSCVMSAVRLDPLRLSALAQQQE